MREHVGQDSGSKLLSLLTPPRHKNTPVLAVDGIAVSGGVDHGEPKLHSSLFDLHGRCLYLHCPLNLLCGVGARKVVEEKNKEEAQYPSRFISLTAKILASAIRTVTENQWLV